MVGLVDLQGLFEPKRFCDSKGCDLRWCEITKTKFE